MAQLKVDLTVRKTVWFYLVKLSCILHIFWLLKSLDGKTLANLYVGGKFRDSIKLNLSEFL